MSQTRDPGVPAVVITLTLLLEELGCGTDGFGGAIGEGPSDGGNLPVLGPGDRLLDLGGKGGGWSPLLMADIPSSLSPNFLPGDKGVDFAPGRNLVGVVEEVTNLWLLGPLNHCYQILLWLPVSSS